MRIVFSDFQRKIIIINCRNKSTFMNICRLVDYLLNIFYNDFNNQISRCVGDSKMTANEIELLNIIRENDNQETALMTAAVIILGFLKQHESSEEQVSVDLRVRA